MTYDEWLKSFKNSPHNLRNVTPPELIDLRMCLIAVWYGGWTIENAQKYLPNDAKLLAEVSQLINQSFAQLPPNLQTQEVAKAYISRTFARILQIPSIFFDDPRYQDDWEGYWFQAVSENPSVFSHVPVGLQSARICKVAIREDHTNIPKVADALAKLDMADYIAAVKKNINALQYVPDIYRLDADFYLKLIEEIYIQSSSINNLNLGRRLAEFFALIPLQAKGVGFWCGLVSLDAGLFVHVPECERSAPIYEAMIRGRSRIIEFYSRPRLNLVPIHFINAALCVTACDRDWRELEQVPLAYKDRELCELTCAKDSRALKFVPERIKDRWLCESACQNYGRALEFVPYYSKTQKLCEIACLNDARAISFVPNRLRSLQVCISIVKQAPVFLKDVPEVHKVPKLIANLISRDTERSDRRASSACLLSISPSAESLTSYEIFIVRDAKGIDDLARYLAQFHCVDSGRSWFSSENDPCVVTDQPSWTLGERSQECDECPDYNAIDDEIDLVEDDCESGWRMEAMAHYSFAHQVNNREYGIHISLEAIADTGIRLSASCPDVSEETFKILTLYLTLYHEGCHAWIEDLCSILDDLLYREIGHVGDSRYAKTMKKYHGYIFMEEAICNTWAYMMLKNQVRRVKWCGNLTSPHPQAMDAIHRSMRKEPRGYRDFLDNATLKVFCNEIKNLLSRVYGYPLYFLTSRGGDLSLEMVVSQFFSNAGRFSERAVPLYLHTGAYEYHAAPDLVSNYGRFSRHKLINLNYDRRGRFDYFDDY